MLSVSVSSFHQIMIKQFQLTLAGDIQLYVAWTVSWVMHYCFIDGNT